VFAAALAGVNFRGHEVATIVGLGSTGVMASLLYLSVVFGKVTVSTLNAYGSFMCVATIISGFRSRLEISARQRMVFVLVIVAASTTLALLGQYSFLNTFKYFILFLLTFFTPWSAINLVDYYFINKERYDIPALSDPAGRYGRWNMRGISVYVVGVLIQLPFVDTHFYSGPMVAQLGGVDISWIVGLVVPGILYYGLARTSMPAVAPARN
jgi:NCS1 family nucleobase:cation symporter-1